MKSLTKEKRYDLIDAFNSTSRYLVDLLNIDKNGLVAASNLTSRAKEIRNNIYQSDIRHNIYQSKAVKLIANKMFDKLESNAETVIYSILKFM